MNRHCLLPTGCDTTNVSLMLKTSKLVKEVNIEAYIVYTHVFRHKNFAPTRSRQACYSPIPARGRFAIFCRYRHSFICPIVRILLRQL
jgi:hypothetical protein